MPDTSLPAPPPDPSQLGRDFQAGLDLVEDRLRQTRAAQAAAQMLLGRNEWNRLWLLALHGTFGTLIGLAFLPTISAGQSWTLLRHIPGFPVTMGLLLATGGLVLVPATIRRHRLSEMLGLAIMMSWYATMSIGFLVAIVLWYRHPTGPRPAVYPPLLYGHWLVTMAVQIGRASCR